jgi:hypothetical protein
LGSEIGSPATDDPANGHREQYLRHRQGRLLADFLRSRMSASFLLVHRQPARRVIDGRIASPRLRRDHEQ